MLVMSLCAAPAAIAMIAAPALSAPKAARDDLVLVADPVAGAAKEQQRKRVLVGKFDAPLRLKATTFAATHVKLLLASKGNPADDIAVLRSFAAGDRVVVHVRHTHAGIPVFGSEAIVEMETDGAVARLVDDVKPVFNHRKVSTTPGVPAATAVATALATVGTTADKLSAPADATLWFLRDRKGDDRLVWRVALQQDGHAAALPVLFIDAAAGKQVVHRYDNLQTASAAVTGTSNYHGTVSLSGYQSGTSYYLEDTTRKLGILNFKNGTTTLTRMTDSDGVYNAIDQRVAVDAHHALRLAYDYFKAVHGRDGIDGAGGPATGTAIDGVTKLMIARVHYSTKYNNAFWNGQSITFGDGDGTTLGPLTTLDIAGHELTHGVIERTAGLIYNGESGALNESFSDVFGAMIERHARGESANTWKIGEEAYTPANGTGDALRYMDNPHLAANNGFTSDDDPDHYSERYTGTADNSGVHINSGIPNKAFYLLAKGGSHHLGGSMTGIGADAAAKIWFKALTTYMTSGTTFAGARTATLDAATALHGATSSQYAAVCSAWTLVGVGTSCSAAPPANPNAPELLTNGGFESSLSPWISSGTGAAYINSGNFPQAGTGYIYFGSANNAAGQIYQQITIPASTSPTLSFQLGITTSETTATTQYDKLFVEVRNSAGTLLATLATYSNLDKTNLGTYVPKTMSLAAYAGQTVRIQLRTTTDSSAITTFRVDSASVR
jgi:Zn-dependent metalloprotease